MHYSLPGGRLVKSENAAKPESQSSKFLIALLSELPSVSRTVDYGCGKLRYCDPLLHKTDHLSLVDSEIQVSRRQILKGNLSSIRDLFKGSNRVSVFSVDEFQHVKYLYDRAICVNVLSAIPFLKERINVVENIFKNLNFGSDCLFVVQYRNSDFTRMSNLSGAEPWEDGFILKSLRGYSFYALIAPNALAALVESVGFEIVSVKLNQGSAYVWARRNPE